MVVETNVLPHDGCYVALATHGGSVFIVVFGVGSATVVRSRCICRDLCFAVGARCSLEGENAANARPIKKCYSRSARSSIDSVDPLVES